MSAGVTWVAIAGLVLSVASLVWQATVTWARLPRLEVGFEPQRARQSTDEGEQLSGTQFVITVHNKGAEAVELYDLGVESETGVRFSARTSKRVLVSAGSGRLENRWKHVRGPELPVTVPARSTLSWTILDGATIEHGSSVPWRGWVERYRASGKPRHTASKTTSRRAS